MADKRISQLVDRGTIANNDVVPIVVSGAVTTNKATISSIQTFMQGNLDFGVTSVGITLGSSGTDVSVTGSPITTSGNITINIPTASVTARGLVSTGTQTFAGAKTFSSDVNINEVNVGRGGGNFTSNTRVGLAALNANTTGLQNTALGTQSLLLSTTGSFNTGVGFNALLRTTVGAANTAVGSQALMENTTGTSNTAIGNSAGRNNTTGENNSFLGSLSGGDNTTGSSNVAVGLSALSRNITGGQNTAIGRDAGRWIADGVTNNTNTNSSIYIGFFSKANADNQTNQIVIGHNAIGQGSNTVTIGNSSITSNKFFGRVIHADAVNADESATLGQVNTSLGGFVTLGTAQTITAQKTFTTSGSTDSVIISHGSGSGIALDVIKAGSGQAIRVQKTSGGGDAVTITGGRLLAENGTFTGQLSTLTGGHTITLTSNLNGATNRIESSARPLEIVTAGSAITLAAGGTTPQITLAGSGLVTLTGALNGTSAVFSGAVSVGLGLSAGIFNKNTPVSFSTDGTLNSPGLTLFKNSDSSTDHVFRVQSFIGGVVTVASITATGAATFSSSVTAASASLNRTSLTASNPLLWSTSGTLDWFLGSSPLGNSTSDLSLYSYGTSSVVFHVAKSTGNVGIGTATPSSILHIEGSTPTITINRNGGSAINTINFNSFGSNYASIISNGGVGEQRYSIGPSVGWGGFQTFYTDTIERMRISSGGQMRVGTSDINASAISGFLSGFNGIGSKVSNNAFFLFSGLNSSDTLTFFVLGTGDVKNTNNSYGAISDIKLKENIEDATPKLDDLMKVKVRNYNLIGDDKKQIGVIAQELEEIFPAMIDESEDFEEVEVPQLDEDGNQVLNEEGEVITEKQRVSKGTFTKSVKYSVFVPMLIKAIQEQQEQIDSLKNQIK